MRRRRPQRRPHQEAIPRIRGPAGEIFIFPRARRRHRPDAPVVVEKGLHVAHELPVLGGVVVVPLLLGLGHDLLEQRHSLLDLLSDPRAQVVEDVAV